MNFVRQLFVYLELFFVPLLAFFAVGGVLQTLEVSEGLAPSQAPSPMWFRTAAVLHRPADLEEHPPLRPDFDHARMAPPSRQFVSFRLTILALAISVILVIPWLLRLYRTFMQSDEELLFGSLLVLGALLPAALIFL